PPLRRRPGRRRREDRPVPGCGGARGPGGLPRRDALQGPPAAGSARTGSPAPARRAVPRRAHLRVGSGSFAHGARAHRLPARPRDRHLPHHAPPRRGRAPLRPGGGPEDAPALGRPARRVAPASLLGRPGGPAGPTPSRPRASLRPDRPHPGLAARSRARLVRPGGSRAGGGGPRGRPGARGRRGRRHPRRGSRALTRGRLPRAGGEPGMTHRVRALIRKEFAEYRRNKLIVITMTLLPGAFLLVAARAAFALPANASPALLRAVFGQARLFLLILPLFLPSTIAAYSVIGEREQGALEPVLTTPATDGELLLGKAVAPAVPAIGLSWLLYAGYLAFAAAIGKTVVL